jgi:sugar phosphate isomerase/epimerase
MNGPSPRASLFSPQARPLLALSTMWAMQPRFEHDLGAFAERAAELGYEAIEINASMDAQMAGAILAGGALPVASIHAPAPLERHPTAGWNRDLNLASLDETERSLAVGYTKRSVDLAADAGARYVVVHIGRVADHELIGERRLRELYPRRDLVATEWERTVDHTVRERASLAASHIEPAQRSLAELAAYAESRAVTIGIESMQPYHQLPLPDEGASLLEPYPGHIVGYWHDVGHGEVLHRLGLVDRSAWFDVLGARLIGAHLHDMRGLTDHRAPGNGDVDYAWLAKRIPAGAARTLEIDQHEPDDSLVRSIEVLRGVGI